MFDDYCVAEFEVVLVAVFRLRLLFVVFAESRVTEFCCRVVELFYFVFASLCFNRVFDCWYAGL